MVLDRQVLAFDGAGFVKTFAERCHIARVAIGRSVSDKPDHRQRWLLRTRPKRPRNCCAAHCEYEFSPSEVDCHAAPPAGGRVHANREHNITLCEGTNNAFALRKS